MAIQSQPSRIPEPFAGSGSKNVIPATNTTPSASQAASWASGFPPECSQPISAGGCPVPRNDVNGALNQISQDFAFRQDGGIWEWSALADYDISRMVRGSDGGLYWSVAQSGPSVAAGAVDPTTDDGTYWTKAPTNDSDIVHKTTPETISGLKSFEDGLLLLSTNGNVYGDTTFIHANSKLFECGLNYSNTYSDYLVNDKNGSAISGVILGGSANGGCSVQFRLFDVTSTAADKSIVSVHLLGSNNFSYFTFCPLSANNNQILLGQAGARWTQLYAVSGTINTSDERTKSSIASIPDDVLDAWGEVGFVQYQFNDAVEKKGEAARLHSGLVAQRIDEIFKSRGLDASRYALFCYDSWEAQPEKRDEKGNVVEPAREAGDEYSLRYEEALCMEAAYQRRRADRAEARIAALEERLAAIEAKLG